jgi:hypothetical protein
MRRATYLIRICGHAAVVEEGSRARVLSSRRR